MLRLCNSLTQIKEKFVPFRDKKVKIYVCGITPYDTTHLGHAFTYVFFDVLVRYLRFRGYEVTYTQNVTDIDDDILKKARREKRDWRELGNFWTRKFLKDMSDLNVLLPDHYVKATDSIKTIIKIIGSLIVKKLAYEVKGNVYFNVEKFKDYGKLSKFNKKQMKILLKERGGNPKDQKKINSLDFLLWQKSKSDEPSWKSPFGDGRPGWHIECSAMIKEFLGDQINIHGGGRDLIYPHHESEIAQSESFTSKKPFVKYWVHTSMVLYQGEKMSKSLGNLIMVSDLLKLLNPNEIRWLLLSHHYKRPWEFEKNELKGIKKLLLSIKNATKRVDEDQQINNNYIKKFIAFMDDDLNTPGALNFLLDIAKKPNISPTLLKCLSILGFKH